MFGIQDEISRAIVDTLKLKLSREQSGGPVDANTQDLAVYNLYLRGRFHVNQRTADALRKAIEHFDQATIAAPSYAPAYAGLADAYCLLSIHAPIPPRSLMPKAKAAALKAVSLDDSLGLAHASLGFIHATYDWEWQNAEREFVRALELNPGDADARHWYAIDVLTPQERLDEALVELTRAVRLDPLSRSINTSLGGLYHDRREYQKAIDQYQTTIDLEPNFYFSYWNLGRTYEQLGQFDRAMQACQTALSLAPHSYLALTQMARCHAATGNPDEARRILRQLDQLGQKMFVPSTAPALIHFSLGENDRAFELMFAACDERPVWLIWSKVSPTYDAVRSDPRFSALLERLGL
ncbi:MAG TPA: tetratricopeptide repeat protein [Vicinamibacterales bacterium]|nr:tetratricopeptide repeat protein [Vicinamibacterales bacterium]